MKRQDHEPPKESELNAFLDQGSAFEGKLTFRGAVRIDGSFTGDVLSEDLLMIGETGQIEGNVEVGEIVIGGRLKGTLKAAKRTRLRSSAVFEGELTTGGLIVEEGATVDGKIEMQGAQTRTRELEHAVADTLQQQEEPSQAG